MKWSYSEIDKLYREFEVKKYTVEKIALEHERTVDAIWFKLKSEGLINEEEEEEDEIDDDDEEEEEEVTDEDEEDDEDYVDESESESDSDEDGEEYVDSCEEDEDEEESVGAQISTFSSGIQSFGIKCLFAYFNVINKLVDVIFEVPCYVCRMVFIK